MQMHAASEVATLLIPPGNQRASTKSPPASAFISSLCRPDKRFLPAPLTSLGQRRTRFPRYRLLLRPCKFPVLSQHAAQLPLNTRLAPPPFLLLPPVPIAPKPLPPPHPSLPPPTTPYPHARLPSCQGCVNAHPTSTTPALPRLVIDLLRKIPLTGHFREQPATFLNPSRRAPRLGQLRFGNNLSVTCILKHRAPFV